MTRATIFSFLIVISVFTSCQGDQENTNNGASDESTIEISSPTTHETLPAFGSVKDDTLFVYGKFVIFYGPVEKVNSDQKQVKEAIKNFKAISETLIDSLSKYPDINSVYTTASYFKIYNANGTTMVVSKAGFKEEMGVVAGDGLQPPTMKKGISTTGEYYKFLKQYFFLK